MYLLKLRPNIYILNNNRTRVKIYILIEEVLFKFWSTKPNDVANDFILYPVTGGYI